MSEHIDGDASWLTSGGHVWIWDPRVVAAKTLRAAGISGAWSFNVAVGERAGRITGRSGMPGALIKAASHAAMTAAEAIVEGLIHDGSEVAWEDDAGRSGTALVLKRYIRRTPRLVTAAGVVWQYYELQFTENLGGF